jgi:integration host factor subunit alpha
MRRTEVLQEVRKMRFEEAYGGFQERRLTQEEAARLLGVCGRTFRRYMNRYEEEGVEGLIFEHLDLSRSASAKAVEATFEIIKRTLDGGEDVLISGFGKLCVKGKRRGRNPGTGQDLMLAERRVVTLKCSQGLKRRLMGARGALRDHRAGQLDRR